MSQRFSLAVVVWGGTEKYHLSLSSTWKAIPISRPTHTFFLGKLRIHCLISPNLFFIAEKRDLYYFLTCEKRELDHSLLLARNTYNRTFLPFVIKTIEKKKTSESTRRLQGRPEAHDIPYGLLRLARFVWNSLTENFVLQSKVQVKHYKTTPPGFYWTQAPSVNFLVSSLFLWKR